MAATQPAPRAVELVVMVAGLMSLNALAIDVMLPALPQMGQALGVVHANHRQYVVIGFVLGMGTGQLAWGPLSDRFGRKPILLVSLLAYAAFGAACAIPGSFVQLVLFRTLQGVAAAGARVISLSLVRDLYRGSAMARVMSWVLMVFMAVPILAPNVGWLVLQVATWREIFWLLVAFGVVMAFWIWARLPETLPRPSRRPLDVASLISGYREFATNRTSLGYMLAVGFVFGALFAFISASEQVFAGFGRQDSFPLYFAGVASAMAVASFANARLVGRFGARAISHRALWVFCLIQLSYCGLLSTGSGGFLPFYATMVASFFCLSLMGANFNAIAMEPMGHIAGTASAALGFASTTVSGTLGGFIGQRYDGTPFPLALGFLSLGLAALTTVTLTEAAPRSGVEAETGCGARPRSQT